jgi:3-isopropylmalate dehydrogenase
MSQSNALRLAVLAGDGVGPEITAATIEILQAAAQRANLPLDLEELPIGYKSYNKWKSTLTEETVQKLRGHNGWILGPTFAGEYPKDDPIRGHPSGYLRKNFGLFANVRPVKAWPQLNPLIADLDVTVIRENTQGFYPDRNMFWGYGEFLPTADVGISVRVITTAACDRFARFSLEYATALGHESLSILHKRTALPQTEGLFIGAFEKLKNEFPMVKTEVVRVDTFSSSLPRDYKKYKLVATTNLFGARCNDQSLRRHRVRPGFGPRGRRRGCAVAQRGHRPGDGAGGARHGARHRRAERCQSHGTGAVHGDAAAMVRPEEA